MVVMGEKRRVPLISGKKRWPAAKHLGRKRCRLREEKIYVEGGLESSLARGVTLAQR